MPYFGYSRYPMKVRTRSIISLVSSALCSPSVKTRRRAQQLLLLLRGLLAASLEESLSGTGLEVLDVAEDQWHERGGTFAPPRPRDVDFTDTAHAVLLEPGRNGVPGPTPPSNVGSS